MTLSLEEQDTAERIICIPIIDKITESKYARLSSMPEYHRISRVRDGLR